MRILGILLACMLAVGAATSAKAEGDADRRLALARELVELSQGDNVEKSIRGVVDGQMSNLQGLTDTQAEWMRENAADIMVRLSHGLIDQMVTATAETYTVEELQAQVDFYHTPVGTAIAAKAFDLGVRQGQVIAQFQMDFMQELIGKFCAEFSCPGMPNGAAASTPRKPA
jgi:uncharacterized protein